MGEDFFEHRLALLLKKMFGVDLPVVKTDSEGPCIVHRDKGSSGDPWSGHNYYGEVELMNFVRPDNQERLWMNLYYSLHDLSGQMDNWTVAATGLQNEELEEFRSIFLPYYYQGFHLGNYISIHVTVDGKEIEVWDRGSKIVG